MGYSFIIPVYNCRKTLRPCVESIRSAALSQYEILLIDDGSTDGSSGLCDTLAEKFLEIRVFHQRNAGVSAARNLGLREAKMDNLLFADGDDTVDGRALREVLRAEGDLVIFGAEGVACHGAPGELDWRRKFVELFWENSLSPVWNKVYKKRILQENSLYFREDMFVYEDLEFVLWYLAHCETVVNVPVAAYRYHPSGKASQRAKRLERISDVLMPLSDALKALELPGKTADAVALGLYEILAREKITVSNLAEIKEICADFQGWYVKSNEKTNLSRKMLGGRVLTLWLGSRWEKLRHALAVMLGRGTP